MQRLKRNLLPEASHQQLKKLHQPGTNGLLNGTTGGLPRLKKIIVPHTVKYFVVV